MATKYPELMENTSITEEARTELEEALKACWQEIPTSFFKLLLDSC